MIFIYILLIINILYGVCILVYCLNFRNMQIFDLLSLCFNTDDSM